MTKFRAVASTIDRLSRLYTAEVLWEMVCGDSLSLEQMRDEQAVTSFSEQLSERLLSVASKGSAYTVVVRKDQGAAAVFSRGQASGPWRRV